MKKYYLIILLCVAFQFSQSQTFEIEYNSILLDEIDDYGYFSFDNSILTTNGVVSEYKVTSKDTVVVTKLFGPVDTSQNKYQFTHYKNLNKKTVFYKETRGLSKPKIIEDNYKIEWDIIPESKGVLGFNCQKAIGHFRGRDYIAYFTKELPINDGPYKFDGLPGLILQVKSLDGSLNIKAKTITNIEEDVPPNPYFGLESTINFKKYKKMYKKYFDTMTGYRPDLDSEMLVPKRYIEVMVND